MSNSIRIIKQISFSHMYSVGIVDDVYNNARGLDIYGHVYTIKSKLFNLQRSHQRSFYNINGRKLSQLNFANATIHQQGTFSGDTRIPTTIYKSSRISSSSLSSLRAYCIDNTWYNFSSLHVIRGCYGSRCGNDYVDKKGRKTKMNREKIIVDKFEKMARRSFIGIPLVDSAIRYMFQEAKSSVKNHFGMERDVEIAEFPSDTRRKFYNWLAQYCPAMRKRLNEMRRVMVDEDPILLNSLFFVKFDECTFGTVQIGDMYRSGITNSRALRFSDDDRVSDSTMHIYIFGRHAWYHFGKMHNILSKDRRCGRLWLYNVSKPLPKDNNDFAFTSTRQELPHRELSTIFMEPGVVENVTNHIDKYLSNREIYSGRGIIYKTGILLYGKPGTGKTSLITAIASKYGRDLIKIDMPSFEQLDVDALVQTLNLDESKYIIALEDIDCIIADRENTDIDKDDKKVVNKLLQFLDSTSSPNDVIFIASTNHKELLDDALLREGRFDLQQEITGIYTDRATDMCKSFNLTNKQIARVLNRVKSSGIDLSKTSIRQSKLQHMILSCLDMSIREELCDGD